MANVAPLPKPSAGVLLPALENGDHLDQPTFHGRYETMPATFRAELIGGLVFVPSPLSLAHAELHAHVIGWLCDYVAQTPGTKVCDNATVILGPDSEPQPDAALLIDPRCGGKTSLTDDGYTSGPPELIIEVASSSRAYDLHEKRRDYEQAGVQEYLVLLLRERRALWLSLSGERFEELPADENLIYRSVIFPGLHLDSKGILALDLVQVRKTLQEGIAQPSHAEFIRRLQSRQAH